MCGSSSGSGVSTRPSEAWYPFTGSLTMPTQDCKCGRHLTQNQMSGLTLAPVCISGQSGVRCIKKRIHTEPFATWISMVASIAPAKQNKWPVTTSQSFARDRKSNFSLSCKNSLRTMTSILWPAVSDTSMYFVYSSDASDFGEVMISESERQRFIRSNMTT